VLGRYRKSAPSRPAIIASLMAYTTNNKAVILSEEVSRLYATGTL
jgi:hypothetical protein